MKKATGIVRRLDDLGRIVIPKELRRVYGVEPGDAMEIFTTGEEIILRRYVPPTGCTFCGTVAYRYADMGDHRVCLGCAELIMERLQSCK